MPKVKLVNHGHSCHTVALNSGDPQNPDSFKINLDDVGNEVDESKVKQAMRESADFRARVKSGKIEIRRPMAFTGKQPTTPTVSSLTKLTREVRSPKKLYSVGKMPWLKKKTQGV